MFLDYENFLDLKTCSSLKGILACLVLICHLHANISLFSNNIFGTVFSAFGYLAVSVFFFLSGYGLCEASFKNKLYIREFPQKKLLPFFLICSFTILIYLLRDIFVGTDIDFTLLIQSFFFGKTIVDNGWYLQSQLLFYLFFYIVNIFSKENNTHKMFGYFFVFALYYILCASHQLSSTWYESSFCFPLGILYSKYKQNINCYVFKSKNKTAIISILVFILFMATLFFGNKPLLISQIRILIKSISSLFFSVLTILIISFVSPKNIITSFLGKISLEIYLLQGIFLNIFRNQFPIKNDWLYVLTVIVFTIIFSVLSHPIYKYIGNITKKHRINKKLA